MRWQDGYPCDTNSTDGQDSARLAGLMWVFDHPEKYQFDISRYYTFWGYKRHPREENKTPFSRDQAVCLFAGFLKSYTRIYVNPTYNPPNGDWISPSVRGHFNLCGGSSYKLFQNLWLWLDVFWSCFIAPMAEPNQLLCMMMCHANPFYLQFWITHNDRWEDAIREYWCSKTVGIYNRGEPEFAEWMIETIKIRVFDTKRD